MLSFHWNAPPGATSCGFLFAAGSLRPRVQRHPVSFAKQEVYILEVTFIVVACITGEYERKRAKRKRRLANSSLGGSRECWAYLRSCDAMTHSFSSSTHVLLFVAGEKIFISRIFVLLSKRGGEKVRKRYFALLFLEIQLRDSRERCIIVAKCASGYRALMGEVKNESFLFKDCDRLRVARLRFCTMERNDRVCDLGWR